MVICRGYLSSLSTLGLNENLLVEDFGMSTGATSTQVCAVQDQQHKHLAETLLRMQILSPVSQLLNQNLHFNKKPWAICVHIRA